jgi:SWI/SNF-related matrix-associated actin-dependent regulator of chromatin subfamily A-like protein 1
MNLYPYQEVGAAFLRKHESVLLADEMGLGKTVQAIVAADLPCLVVCPASLKLNWLREIQMWRPGSKVQIISAGDAWSDKGFDFVIVNYDILHRYEVEVRANPWKTVVLDEAHYIKNHTSNRTKQILGRGDKAKPLARLSARKQFALTGTPIMNRPAELWVLWYWLSPSSCPEYWTYMNEFCGACKDNGWDTRGARNLDKLAKLVEPWMMRRLKSEVLKDLPPKTREVIEIVDEDGSMLRRERESWKQISGGKRLTEGTLESALGDLRVAGIEMTDISRLRHETALYKVPQVVEHITDLLEEVAKVVVFAHHRDVITEIELGLAEFAPAVVHGGIDLEQRQMEVDCFQKDAGCRVFIGQMQAAGVGLTLTAASTVVFAELDWVPGVITQAEDRCHRIGQNDNVVVQHLVLADSLDAYMARTLVRKQKIVEQALNGQGDWSFLE